MLKSAAVHAGMFSEGRRMSVGHFPARGTPHLGEVAWHHPGAVTAKSSPLSPSNHCSSTCAPPSSASICLQGEAAPCHCHLGRGKSLYKARHPGILLEMAFILRVSKAGTLHVHYQPASRGAVLSRLHPHSAVAFAFHNTCTGTLGAGREGKDPP